MYLFLVIVILVVFAGSLGLDKSVAPQRKAVCVPLECALENECRGRRDALVETARTSNYAGLYEEAECAFRSILNVYPDDRIALGELADLVRHRGRYEESESLFKRALAVAPDDPWLYLDLGKLYRNMHRPAEALAMFDKSLSLDPNEPYAWSYGLSQLHLQTGDYQEAEEAGLWAIELDPNTSFHYMSLGDVYAGWQKHEKAIAMFEKALALDPKSEAYKGLGQLHLKAGDLATARAWFEKFNDNVPRPRGEVEMGLGFIAQQEGRYEDAMKHFEYAAYLDPTLGGEEHVRRIRAMPNIRE